MLRWHRLIALALVVSALAVLGACGGDDADCDGGGGASTSAQQGPDCGKGEQRPEGVNDSNDVVTDLPTAFYISAAQVPGSKIVGQFSAPGSPERVLSSPERPETQRFLGRLLGQPGA
jgi:hypothetical protein